MFLQKNKEKSRSQLRAVLLVCPAVSAWELELSGAKADITFLKGFGLNTGV